MTGDNPRGVDHFLRDRLNVPRIMGAKLPCEPDEAKVEESVISAADCSFEIDGDSGHVGTINGQPTQLGLLKYKESPVTRRECRVDTGRIVFEGTLAGFGDVKLTYCVSGDSLFCTVEAMAHDWRPDCATPYWEDCIYLAHLLPDGAQLLRHSSGFFEPTERDEFFSPQRVTVKRPSLSWTLGHGGNLFFKRAGAELRNRLWAYNEISGSFWWSLSVDSA